MFYAEEYTIEVITAIARADHPFPWFCCYYANRFLYQRLQHIEV